MSLLCAPSPSRRGGVLPAPAQPLSQPPVLGSFCPAGAPKVVSTGELLQVSIRPWLSSCGLHLPDSETRPAASCTDPAAPSPACPAGTPLPTLPPGPQCPPGPPPPSLHRTPGGSQTPPAPSPLYPGTQGPGLPPCPPSSPSPGGPLACGPQVPWASRPDCSELGARGPQRGPGPWVDSWGLALIACHWPEPTLEPGWGSHHPLRRVCPGLDAQVGAPGAHWRLWCPEIKAEDGDGSGSQWRQESTQGLPGGRPSLWGQCRPQVWASSC